MDETVRNAARFEEFRAAQSARKASHIHGRRRTRSNSVTSVPLEDRTRNNIVTYSFDQRKFDEHRADPSISSFIANLLNGDEDTGRPPLLNAEELIQDLWLTLYRADPELQPKGKVHRDAWINREIIQSILDHPSYEGLHANTFGDVRMSIMVMEELMPAVEEALVANAEVVNKSNDTKIKTDRIVLRDPVDPDDADVTDPNDLPGGEIDVEEVTLAGSTGPVPDLNKDVSVELKEGGEIIDERTEIPEEEEHGPIGGGGQSGGTPTDGGSGSGQMHPDDAAPEGLDDLDDLTGLSDEELDHWLSEQDLEGMLDALDDTMFEAPVQQIEDDLLRQEEAAKGFGVSRADLSMMGPEERLEFMQLLQTPDMIAAADLFGRHRACAFGAQRTKTSEVHHVAYDVEFGDNLRRVLPSEYAYLSTPETRMVFFQKLAAAELSQWKLRGKDDADKGPIVVGVDRSGSMGVGKMNWAIGAAGAIKEICRAQGRDCYVFFFDHQLHLDDGQLHFTAKEKLDVRKLMTLLSVKAQGGTNFELPLNRALDIVQTAFDEKSQGEADIVLITDGACSVGPDFLSAFQSERERIGTRVFSIFVGGDPHTRADWAHDILSSFSDMVIPVTELVPESIDKVYKAL